MSLKHKLIEQITLHGPISVADYMYQCLLDPEDGYYTQHVALGEDGDFITAPMVSQMFGEMIGVWMAQVWQNMGAPKPFRLVEVGGGDGTLMSDVLRVVAKVPDMGEAAMATFVEPSPRLAQQQRARIENAQTFASLDDLPEDLPIILIANEILDCLPARQFVRTERGWHERCVGVRHGELVFGLVEAADFSAPFDAADGETVEVSPAQAHFARQLAEKLKITRGAALLIDYGRDRPGTGDTLQALHRHKKQNPLAAPGEHDLTVWADFPTVQNTARKTGVKCSVIVTQRAFLEPMGIGARMDIVQERNPGHEAIIERQYERLMAPEHMGSLFRVVGLAWPVTIALPGLEAVPEDA